MKKLAVLMSLVLALFAMPLTVFAEHPASPYAAGTPAVPNWDITASASSTLYPEGDDVTCVSIVNGASSVTSITVEQTLEVPGILWFWKTYDNESEWTKTVKGNAANVYNYKYDLASGKYRLKSVFTLETASGKSETVTVYSETITIS